MSFQTVFRRYEIKYLISEEQKEALMETMGHYMKLDQYGRTTINNIYYDTEHYLLARRSAEKPIFKEKLRVRSYGRATPDDTVFVELKRKYDSVVYKRRIALPKIAADDWILGGVQPGTCKQIEKEITYFLEFYQTLKPKVFLSYEREAFYALDGSDFRITFDENILARGKGYSFIENVYAENRDYSYEENEPIENGKYSYEGNDPTGNDWDAFDKNSNERMKHKDSCGEASVHSGDISLLEEGMTLLEVKTSRALPLWLVKFLSENHIYKTSFSKYGTAYERIICDCSEPYEWGSEQLQLFKIKKEK